MMIQATEKDTDYLYDIIKKCSEWLQYQGVQQWNPVYPKKLFSKDVRSGSVFYFIADGGEVIGTATLYKRKPFYYPKEILDDGAEVWYVCRFAVPRRLKNRNFGTKIVHEIETEAKNHGIKRIRIDVVKTNPFLEKYYLRLGYVRAGETVLKNMPSILMEKQIFYL